MRLAIADPPYLGRSNRWYGEGRGSGGGKHAALGYQPDADDLTDIFRGSGAVAAAAGVLL